MRQARKVESSPVAREQKILFVMQDANFAPKWLLVPRDAFLGVPQRATDYQVLIDGSEPIARDDGKVARKLTQTLFWTGNCGRLQTTPVSKIIGELEMYNWLEKDQYARMCDVAWVDEAQTGSCRKWDTMKAFEGMMGDPKVGATEGFVVTDVDCRVPEGEAALS